MSEFLPYILGALPILIAVGWYCRRWGRLDESADLARRNAALADLDRKVSPAGNGGPAPEK